jgi:sulfur relay protein TusB/DsrH
MLHLVFSLTPDTALFERLSGGDALVFFDTAVLRVLRGGQLNAALTAVSSAHRLCVLHDELQTRGIRADELSAGIELIDYAELVELTVQQRLIQSWN